jgi:hypothetical protein
MANPPRTFPEKCSQLYIVWRSYACPYTNTNVSHCSEKVTNKSYSCNGLKRLRDPDHPGHMEMINENWTGVCPQCREAEDKGKNHKKDKGGGGNKKRGNRNREIDEQFGEYRPGINVK